MNALAKSENSDRKAPYSIRHAVRYAYRKRYGFEKVTISKDCYITGYWADGTTLPLGCIDDCRTVTNEHRTGVLVYNRDFLIYTMALPCAH